MSDLTKRQHYVPQFYLRQWAGAKGQVTVHDLPAVRTFTCDPAGVLVRNFFYEDESEIPDNRVEKILAEMEARCSATFRMLQEIGKAASQEKDKRRSESTVLRALSDQDLDNLLEFAAYQYLRVPGAIDQKRYEAAVSSLTDKERQLALSPGWFVESGFQYLRNRFRALKVIILVSPATEFITSDLPCFDLKDSPDAPLLGEEIGRDPKVVCTMPLTPWLGAILVSPDYSEEVRRRDRLVVNKQPDGAVRNQNVLIIQQAEQWEVASRTEQYIFTVAAKRKKGRVTATPVKQA